MITVDRRVSEAQEVQEVQVGARGRNEKYGCLAIMPVMRGCRSALPFLLLLVLAACGFRPVYGDPAIAGRTPELAAVKVLPVPERMGQLLTWSLRDSFNPSGDAVPARYTLKIGLQESKATLGVQQNATSTTAVIHLNADYTLTDIASNQGVFHGTSHMVTSFDFVNDGYATTVAEQDAIERAVHDLGQEITLRVALYFRKG